MAVYCTRDDLNEYFGATNVDKWADYDNDQDPVKITANINAAIEWASREVDDSLRGGVVSVDFSAAPNSPPSIKDASRKLAGCQLYSSRGATDFGTSSEALDRLQGVRAEAYKRLASIKQGRMRIELDNYDTGMSPFVTTDTSDCKIDGFNVCP